jgi:hypothetical protein
MRQAMVAPVLCFFNAAFQGIAASSTIGTSPITPDLNSLS